MQLVRVEIHPDLSTKRKQKCNFTNHSIDHFLPSQNNRRRWRALIRVLYAQNCKMCVITSMSRNRTVRCVKKGLVAKIVATSVRNASLAGDAIIPLATPNRRRAHAKRSSGYREYCGGTTVARSGSALPTCRRLKNYHNTLAVALPSILSLLVLNTIHPYTRTCQSK